MQSVIAFVRVSGCIFAFVADTPPMGLDSLNYNLSFFLHPLQGVLLSIRTENSHAAVSLNYNINDEDTNGEIAVVCLFTPETCQIQIKIGTDSGIQGVWLRNIRKYYAKRIRLH